MASSPISRPGSCDGNPEHRQILESSSPPGQPPPPDPLIVLIGAENAALHQCVCRRFQHSRLLIMGGGGAWQRICLLMGLPSSRGGPGGKTDVTGVKSTPRSAQLTHSCVKFLNRCQLEMVSSEITLCEAALRPQSFALTHECVKEGKGSMHHLIAHLSCSVALNPDSIHLKTLSTFFLSFDLKLRTVWFCARRGLQTSRWAFKKHKCIHYSWQRQSKPPNQCVSELLVCIRCGSFFPLGCCHLNTYHLAGSGVARVKASIVAKINVHNPGRP